MRTTRAAATLGPAKRIPGDVREAMSVLVKAGFRVYVVGGAVRDLVLGREPNDYDLATNARPETVMRIFSRRGWVVVPKGVEYGVVSVVHPATGREIEVATFRKEYYPLDYKRRHVIVSFADTIEEDLLRRDFTMNAMALTVNGDVIDPVGGLRDIQSKIVRFVGDPYERIREDPLRMLRAVRFAVQLGFEIPVRDMRAIRDMHEAIRHVAWERIGAEMLKAVKGLEPWRLPKLLVETRLHRVILPELGGMSKVRRGRYGETVLDHTIDVMRRLSPHAGEDRHILMLAALFHDAGWLETRGATGGGVSLREREEVSAEIAERRLYEWRLPRSIITKVVYIVRHQRHPRPLAGSPPVEIAAKMLAWHGDLAMHILLLAYADTGLREFLEAARLAGRRRPPPLLSGRDVMRLYGVEPGPRVGDVKRRLYEIQLRENISSRDELVRVACRKYRLCPAGGGGGGA